MKKSLRILFMGTPEFAVESLSALKASDHEIVAVVTAPDKPAGRGGKLRKSAVKLYCEQAGLTLWQPTNLKDPVFVDQVKKVQPDVIIVVAFRMLPRVVWEIPLMGTINLHASLLPDYRGAAPINWAIINGERQTGVTTFFINEHIDTGDIIDRREVTILPEMNAGELHDVLKVVGARLLVETADKLARNEVTPMKQNESTADKAQHSAPKITKESSRIDWNRPCAEVINLIRGMSPYPGAYTTLQPEGTVVKVFNARKGSSHLEPGLIETDGKHLLEVGTADGSVEIEELQVSGKKRMSVRDFLNGLQNTEQLKQFA